MNIKNRAELRVDWILEAMSHAEATRIFAANGVAGAGQLDAAALKEAWRRLARQWHPDRAGQGSTRKAQDINAAYDVLKVPGSAQHGWHQHRQSKPYQRGYERTREQEQGHAEWTREEERQAAEQTRARRAAAEQQRQANERQRQANERQRQANERQEERQEERQRADYQAGSRQRAQQTRQVHPDWTDGMQQTFDLMHSRFVAERCVFSPSGQAVSREEAEARWARQEHRFREALLNKARREPR